jgi:hypothetical protein
MPFIRGSRRGARRGLAVLATTMAAVAVLPSVAAAACAPTTTIQAFKQFGDTAAYSLVSNGHFEGSASGWTLTRASLAAGNESFKVRAGTDASSLAIQPNGSALSPAFCVGMEHPTFRFFARRTGGTWGVLNVALRWKDASGRVNTTTVGALSGDEYKSWKATQVLPLATTLPLWQAGSSLQVQIVLDPEDFGGAWAIDDVYVDPYSR